MPDIKIDFTDFARLYRIEGIGQVLVTLEENEDQDGAPCLRYRIPDANGIGLTLTVTPLTQLKTHNEMLGYLQVQLHLLTEETVLERIKPLTSAHVLMAGLNLENRKE